MKKCLLVAIPMTMVLSACQTAVPPVEVTRFHAGTPVRTGTVSVEEMDGNPDVGLEFESYAAAVGQELQRLGFSEAKGPSSEYRALVSFRRTFRPTGPDTRRSPVSVGVGGATGSYGSGLGVGIGINLSGKPKDIVYTEMFVQIRRRSDNQAVWEARGNTVAREGTPAAQPGLAAAKLAGALFKDYPGQSGQTISVK
ncbi:MAG: hypothetical protein DI547_09955 [Sphingobium sp.]|nr:MAG: hypothetical protein DI547_09955 [Sphingobium sp.]